MHHLVLLIEDDELIADIVARILTRSGKKVLRARDGAQGAQLFAQFEREIALVILDCGLPDIDGAALSRVLRRCAPNLPIIITSGWNNEAVGANTLEGPTAFLPKPFSPTQVESLVTSMMGATV